VIVYTDSIANITADNLHGFFDSWPNSPSPESHLKLLSNSDEIVLAVDDETGNVIGFITAISDGILSAYISLLEVLPAYQGRGVGSELTGRMLEKLCELYMVDLICDVELQPFYARFGMKPASGMVVRNYERQGGRGQ